MYYGSNVTVKNPRIIESKRALDFGNGFYLTSDLEQAKRWAKAVVERRGKGLPIVSVFEFIENDSLKKLSFQNPNVEWLKFVSQNRKRIFYENKYDIIVGPVANDNTMPVINMYINGQYDEDEALKRLLPQNLKDQVVFKTDESIECLNFIEEILL